MPARYSISNNELDYRFQEYLIHLSISASTTDSSLYLRTSLPCRIREGDYNGELNRLLFPQPPLYLSNPPSITIPLLLPPPHPLGPGIRRGRRAAGARRVRHRLWRQTRRCSKLFTCCYLPPPTRSATHVTVQASAVPMVPVADMLH